MMHFHLPLVHEMNPSYLAQLLKPQPAGADIDSLFTH